MNQFYAGTSNLVLPVKNKSFFPPVFQDKTRLTYYASLFNSIEVNASFYKMPLARTIAKWDMEVPQNFRFSFKLIQAVTHEQKQQFNLKPLKAFLTAINATAKRGCLLIQLPPKFGPDLFQLDLLLNELQNCEWSVAIEFRHSGWYRDVVFERLSSAGVIMVLHDLKASATPLIVTANVVYLRFHGPEGGYRGSYADDFLYEYAEYIHDWISEGKTVYAYFNNTLGAAVHNLQTLNKLL